MSKPTDLVQGTLDLLILKVIALEPMHGWAIAQRIRQMSGDVLLVGQSALYPSLHKLEQNGWISAEVGDQREQPARQVLHADQSRAEGTRSGGGAMGAAVGRDLARSCAPSEPGDIVDAPDATCFVSGFGRSSRAPRRSRSSTKSCAIHLARQIEEDIAAGMAPDDARRAARRSLSGVEQRKEECRDTRGLNLVDNVCAGSALRRPPARQESRLRGHGRPDARPRHGRQRGDLRLRGCRADQAAALPGSRAARQRHRSHGRRFRAPTCRTPTISTGRRLNTVFSSMDVHNGRGYMLRTPDGHGARRPAPA